MNGRGCAALVAVVLAAACGSGPPGPATLDTRNERCRFCHMVVSDARTGAQLVAPGEEPAFFDDLGCLASYLAGQKSLKPGSTAYVADHRTRDWIRADAALYTRVPGLTTPMGSHLLAHADAPSREADPFARGGTSVPIPELFGPWGPPPGRRSAGGDGR